MSKPRRLVEARALRSAQQRVRARLGLFGHSVIYTGVMVLLIVLNIAATPDNLRSVSYTHLTQPTKAKL